MEFTGNNQDERRIHGLLDQYLGFRSKTAQAPADGHLDEDTITAFVEGSLTEREAAPIVRHLTECGFCLHVTSELARLDCAFADEPAPAAAAEPRPAKVSEVLSGLISRIFGSADGAVFAHEDRETDAEDAEPDAEKKEE